MLPVSNVVQHSQRSFESCHRVLVDGNLLCGTDLRDYAKRHGLCRVCATTKTHRRAGNILNRSWDPITTKDDNDNYVVYKGYCLQPTCYTLTMAQERLGERRLPRKSISSSTSTSSRRGGRRLTSRIHTLSSSSTATTASTVSPSAAYLRKAPPCTNSFLTATTSNRGVDPEDSMRSLFHPEFPFINEEEDHNLNEEVVITEKVSARKRPLEEEIVFVPDGFLRDQDSPLEEEDGKPEGLSRTSVQEQLQHALEQTDVSRIVEILHKQLSLLESHNDEDESSTLIVGLQQLSQCVRNMHQSRHNGGTDVSGWAKVIWNIIQQQTDSPALVMQCLQTLSTVSALSPLYAKEAVSCDNSVHVLVKLATGKSDKCSSTVLQEAASVLMESWTSYYGDQQIALENVDFLLQQLAQQLDSNDEDPADEDSIRLRQHQVRSLYHLARRNDESRLSVQEALTPNSHVVLVDLLARYSDLTTVGIQATLSLLYYVSCQTSQSEHDQPSTTAVLQVDALLSILSTSNSSKTHLAALLLLQSLAPSIQHQVQDCIVSVCHTLTHHSHEPDELVRLGVSILHQVVPKLSGELSAEQKQVLVHTLFEIVGKSRKDLAVVSMGIELMRHSLKSDSGSRDLVSKTGGGSHAVVDLFCRFAGQFEDQENLHRVKLATALATEELARFNCLDEEDNKAVLFAVLGAAQLETDKSILTTFLKVIAVVLPRITSDAVSNDEIALSSTATPAIGTIFSKLVDANKDSVADTTEILTHFAALYRHNPFPARLDACRVIPAAGSSISCITHSQQELGLVLDIMVNTKKSTSAQNACCIALSSFLGPRGAPAMRPLSGLPADALPILLETLSRHREDARLQESAADAFFVWLCLCSHEERNEWTARLVGHCLECADSGEEKTPTRMVACKLLSNLSDGSTPGGLVQGTTTFQFLVSLLRQRNSEVVSKATEVMSVLLQRDAEEIRQALRDQDVAFAIVECLERQRNSKKAQVSLFSVLLSQSVLQEAGLRRDIANHGGLEAIVESILIHYADTKYITRAYRCFLAILAVGEGDIVWTRRERIGQAITVSFDAHTDNMEIQSVATDVLRSLLIKEKRIRKVLAAAVIPSLLSSMKNHFSSCVLLANGCAIIRMVSRYDEQHSLIQHGAVEVLVNVMLQHPNSSNLLTEALATLTKLARDPTVRQSIDRERAEASIVRLIQANARNPDILKEAFGALNNIVVDMTTKSVARIPDQVLAVLLNAVRCFLDVEGLQVNASLLLKSYTYAPENLHMLQNASEVLVPLLFDVSENYTGEIRERVHYIIHSL